MSRIPSRTSVVLAALVALASAAAPPAFAQRKDEKDKKAEGLTAAQRQEAAPLARLTDDVMKGATAPGTYLVTVPKEPAAKDVPPPQATTADVTLAWRNDFLKAQQGAVFVPFSVSAEGGKPGPVTAYLRVAAKGTTEVPAGDKAPYAFEDLYFAELRTPAAGLPPRITRAFAVAPGAYDVYFALRERPSGRPARTHR